MVDSDRLSWRLDEARKQLQESRSRDVEADLRRRARLLADRELDPEAPDVYAEVVTAKRNELELAIPIEHAREVRRIEVSGLPGSTKFVNGIFQIRGKVLSLVDLGPFYGSVDPVPHGDRGLVIVVGSGKRFLGLRIDELVGPRTVYQADIDDGFVGQVMPFVKRVTRDLVHIVDIEALMAAPEFQLRK